MLRMQGSSACAWMLCMQHPPPAAHVVGVGRLSQPALEALQLRLAGVAQGLEGQRRQVAPHAVQHAGGGRGKAAGSGARAVRRIFALAHAGGQGVACHHVGRGGVATDAGIVPVEDAAEAWGPMRAGAAEGMPWQQG